MPVLLAARRGYGMLLVGLLHIGAYAHELPANRATLVLRERTHITLTMYLDYGAALHQMLAPQLSNQQFLITYTAMPGAAFEKEMQRAQASFEKTTQLLVATKQVVPLTHWVWPSAQRVQEALRQQTMQVMTGADVHLLQEPMEVHAQAELAKAVRGLRMQFAPAFGKVLVVSYRPSQVWAEPNQPSPPIEF